MPPASRVRYVWFGAGVPGGGVQKGTQPAAGRVQGQSSEAVTPTEGNRNSKHPLTASYGLP